MSFALLRTLLWTDPWIIIATTICGSLNLISVPFDKDGHLQMRYARFWARWLCKVMGIRLQVTGLENLQPGQNYIFAGNHRSYSDTPALLSALPGNFRFMAKESLFQIPLMGTHLKTAGHIPVSLSNPRAALKSLHTAADKVKNEKISVLVFPEGGRTEGELEPFKEGAAIIAIKSGVPIVPFGLIGTREVLPMHGVTIRGGLVQVKLGKPIPTSELVFKDKVALTQQVRNEVAALLGVAP